MKAIVWLVGIGIVIWYFLMKHTVAGCTTCGITGTGTATKPNDAPTAATVPASPASNFHAPTHIFVMQPKLPILSAPHTIPISPTSHTGQIAVLNVPQRINYYSPPAIAPVTSSRVIGPRTTVIPTRFGYGTPRV